MHKPLLIILIGPVSSGKTTIGKKISKKLFLPFVSKDNLKEVIFDATGWKDKNYSRKVGKEAYAILYYCISCFLNISYSIIVEANFNSRQSSKKINELIKKYNINVVQLNCWAKKGVLVKRFEERNKLELRHPGHCERYIFEDIKSSLEKGKVSPLNIKGSVINIDTTDLDKVDYKGLINLLRLKMKEK